MKRVIITLLLLLYLLITAGQLMEQSGAVKRGIEANKASFFVEFSQIPVQEGLMQLSQLAHSYESDILYLEPSYSEGKTTWLGYKTNEDPNFILFPGGESDLLMDQTDFLSTKDPNRHGEKLSGVPLGEEYVFHDWSQLVDYQSIGKFYLSSSILLDPIQSREFFGKLKTAGIDVGAIEVGGSVSTFDNITSTFPYKLLVGSLFFVLFICLVFYYLAQRKKASLLYLHGYGSWTVFFTITRWFLVALPIIAVGSFASLLLIFKFYLRLPWQDAGGNFVQPFILVSLGILMGLYILGGLLLGFNISDYLKGKRHGRGAYILSYCSRTLVIGLSLVFLSIVLSQGGAVFTSYFQIRQLSAQTKGYVTFQMTGQYNNSPQSVKAVQQFYDQVSQEFEPIIIESTNYQPYSIDVFSSTPKAYRYAGMNYLTVSASYLDRNTVLDTDEQPIRAQDVASDGLILLVPENYKTDNPNLLAFLDDNSSMVMARLESRGLTAKDIVIQSYSTRSHISAFNPNVRTKSLSPYLDDVMIVVEPEASLQQYMGISRIDLLMSNSYLFFKTDTDNPVEPLLPFLKAANLEDTLRPVSLSDLYSTNLARQGQDIIVFGLVFLALMLVILIILINEVNLYFIFYSKKIAVNRSLGLGFIDIYYMTLILRVIVWNIIFLVGQAYFQGDMTPYFMGSVGLLALLEFSLFYGLSVRKENQRLAQVLKGDWE